MEITYSISSYLFQSITTHKLYIIVTKLIKLH